MRVKAKLRYTRAEGLGIGRIRYGGVEVGVIEIVIPANDSGDVSELSDPGERRGVAGGSERMLGRCRQTERPQANASRRRRRPGAQLPERLCRFVYSARLKINLAGSEK